MTEETLRTVFSRNLTAARRAAGHTQLDLANLLHYSDKSVSKWERGEGLPDLPVLCRICEIYHLTPNEMLSETPVSEQPKERRMFIWLLSVGLCWLVAAVVFFTLYLANVERGRIWLCFLYAVPASAVVSVVFASLWCGRVVQLICVSVLIWSMAVVVHLTALLPGIYLIYVIAGIVQLLFVLWYWLKHRSDLRRM